MNNLGGAESQRHDVLSQLFEKHFHSWPTSVVPLEGQLGGSGRNIIRVSNESNSAIGILYGVREENVASSNSRRRSGVTVCPYLRFTKKTSIKVRIWKKILAT